MRDRTDSGEIRAGKVVVLLSRAAGPVSVPQNVAEAEGQKAFVGGVECLWRRFRACRNFRREIAAEVVELNCLSFRVGQFVTSQPPENKFHCS